MALFKICRGAETNLPTTLTSGYCYFCTDTTNFYIDYTDTYGALTRAKIASKYADKLRYTEDGNFIELDPTDIVTKSNYETAIGVATSDKNGLMSSSDKTKLDGVESGAQVNVQADWNQSDTTAKDYIKNKICYDFSGWKTTFSQLLKTDADNMFISSYYPDYTYAYSFVKKNLEEDSTVKIAIDDSSIDFVVPVSDEAQWGEYTIGDYQIALFGGTGNYGHFIVAMGCKTDISGSTFSIQQYVNETKTIDEKYLPTYLDKLAYCTCTTAASTQAKVAACSVGQFTLTKGQKAVVKFSYANTAVGPTLNIGSTGAKTIYWHGQVLPSTQYWEAGAVLEFVYNGSQFELIGIAKDNSKEYSVATASSDGLFSATDKAKLDGISSGATAVSIDTTLTQSGQAADAKAVGDELAKKLDNPQTAAVGDVLTVEEVDGDGKPTKWKSVDANAVLTIDNTGYKGTDYYALPDGVYNLLSLYVANKDGMNLRLQGVTSVKNHSFACAGKNTTVIFGSDGSVVGYDYGVWRWDEKENVSNKVTSLSATSKDSQYPSAKAVYDALTTAIPTTLPNPNKLTFSGAVTGEYDGSSAVAIEIPKGGKASANFLIQSNGTVLSAPTYAQLTSGTYASFYALYGGTLYALSQQTQTSGTFTFKFNDVPNGKMYVVTVDSSDNTTFVEEELPTTTVTLKTWTSADIS